MLAPSKQIGRFEQFTLPNGEVVYYEDKHHAYYGEIKDNPKSEGGYSFIRASRLTGVSTIAKFLDPVADPLMYWAAKLDQIGIAELCCQALDAGADLTWLREQRSISEALREAKLTWADVRDKRAEEGTEIHEEITFELAMGREAPSLAGLSEEARGYGQAKMSWWRQRRPQPIAAEQVTVDYTRGFAGRFDLFAEFDAADFDHVPKGISGTFTALVDDKTRETGKVRKADHVQLPGYEIANVACGIGPSNAQLILILMPDGTFREEWCAGTEADFNSALLASQSGKHLDKRMREAGKAREAVAA